jgi:hypothetical protein
LSRDLIRAPPREVPALSYMHATLHTRDGHMGCRVQGMHPALVLVALALLGALLGSVWLRRADLEFSGESPTMLLGLAFCLASVLLIVFAAG